MSVERNSIETMGAQYRQVNDKYSAEIGMVHSSQYLQNKRNTNWVSK